MSTLTLQRGDHLPDGSVKLVHQKINLRLLDYKWRCKKNVIAVGAVRRAPRRVNHYTSVPQNFEKAFAEPVPGELLFCP